MSTLTWHDGIAASMQHTSQQRVPQNMWDV